MLVWLLGVLGRQAGLAWLTWKALLALHVGRELRGVHADGVVKWSAQGLEGSGLRLCLIVDIGVVIGGGCGMVGWLGADGSSRTEEDLTGRALAKIADHDHVVAGAIEQLCEDVASGAGSILAIDAGVGGEAFDMRAGERGDFRENLREARVGGVDAEAVAVPEDAGGSGLIIGRPVGIFRSRSDEGLSWGGVGSGRREWLLWNWMKMIAGAAKVWHGMGVGLGG